GGAPPAGEVRRLSREESARSTGHAARLRRRVDAGHGERLSRMPWGRPRAPARQPARSGGVRRLPSRGGLETDLVYRGGPREPAAAPRRAARGNRGQRLPPTRPQEPPAAARNRRPRQGGGGVQAEGGRVRGLPRRPARRAVPPVPRLPRPAHLPAVHGRHRRSQAIPVSTGGSSCRGRMRGLPRRAEASRDDFIPGAGALVVPAPAVPGAQGGWGGLPRDSARPPVRTPRRPGSVRELP